MSDVMDRLNNWFSTKKGAERQVAMASLIDRRKQARKELDKAILDLTNQKSKQAWDLSATSSKPGRSG